MIATSKKGNGKILRYVGTVVLVVIGTLEAVTTKTGKMVLHFPGTSSTMPLRKSAVLESAKILRVALNHSASGRGPTIQRYQTSQRASECVYTF